MIFRRIVNVRSVLIIFYFCVFFAIADEPPSLKNAKIYSENSEYFVWIEKDSLWKISGFKKQGQDSLKIWQSDFNYLGYQSACKLSNDGNIFVQLDSWYYDDYPILMVYNSGVLVGEYTGKEFYIPKDCLTDTESHQIWLSLYNSFRFTETNKIVIKDRCKKLIDVSTISGEMVENPYIKAMVKREQDSIQDIALNELSFSEDLQNLYVNFDLEILASICGILVVMICVWGIKMKRRKK